MSEWWSYRLSDFLMFSPATYWRLVEHYNREVWPLQVLMLAVGAMLLWWVAARRPFATRVVDAVLAAVWLWVAWAFHWERYAPINWAARYFAAAFVVQSLLLIGFALAGSKDQAGKEPGTRRAGLVLSAIGVFLYPLLTLAEGRPWTQGEVFGLMPEPTALVTLGLLLATFRRQRAWLAIIPVLSLLVGAATWWLLRPPP